MMPYLRHMWFGRRINPPSRQRMYALCGFIPAVADVLPPPLELGNAQP